MFRAWHAIHAAGSIAAPRMLTYDEHPRLAHAAFRTHFPRPLGDCASSPEVLALLRGEPGVACPLPPPTDELRAAVRDLLRFGGYKPTGRGKPSSEYLVRAASEGALGSINVAVDVCNAVSLRSGLPISVVDLARTTAPLRIGLAGPGRYVFNAGGQELDHGGLLSLIDASGPCANAVKDAERTKTRASTVETLSILWVPRGFEELAAAATAWSAHLLAGSDARVDAIADSV